jgi:hypothetical protein
VTRQTAGRQTDPEEYFANAVRHGWALEAHREAFMSAVADGRPFGEAIGDLQWPGLPEGQS